MFLNISPSSANFSESSNALLFGQRCRKVELGQAKKNTVSAFGCVCLLNLDAVKHLNLIGVCYAGQKR